MDNSNLLEQIAWESWDLLYEIYGARYGLSFNLSYTDVIDWVCEIGPRRNHPQARKYDLWTAHGMTRAGAIARAVATCTAALAKLETQT